LYGRLVWMTILQKVNIIHKDYYSDLKINILIDIIDREDLGDYKLITIKLRKVK